MANEPTNGADPQTAPAPVIEAKPKTIKKVTTQGRKPRHRSTKAELNREAVTAQIITCLCSGKTIEETAQELGISFTWVERVRKKLPEDFNQYFAEAKSVHISQLIEEGLRMQLESMSNLLKVTRDEVWVNNQRAPEIATLFGVINDKTVRILAAIERANERDRIEQSSVSERPGNASEPITRREPHHATQGT